MSDLPSIPGDTERFQFDPRELRTVTDQDRAAVQPRYNERLNMAAFAPDEQRVITYVAEGVHMRLVRLSPTGTDEADPRWTVLQEEVIPLDAGPETPHEAVADVLSIGVGYRGTASGFHLSVLPDALTAAEFNERWGHTDLVESGD